MNTKRREWTLLIVALLLVSLACRVSLADKQSSEDDRNEINNELTLQALYKTQTAIANPPPQHGDPPPSSPPQGQDDSAPAPPTNGSDDEDCNISKYVSETIPDGSIYQTGDTFTKSWVIRNAGTCQWTTDYRFVFEEGDQMDGPSSMKLTHAVDPGDTYTFEIDLTAPDDDGNYTGVYRIKSDEGDDLGKYWVVITVGTPGPPPAAFAVTSVTYDPAHGNVDMACPGTVNINAEIFSSGAGVVTYKWETSTGATSALKSLNFNIPNGKIVQYTMDIPGPTGDYWAKVYVDNPNHQLFGPKNIHVNCTP